MIDTAPESQSFTEKITNVRLVNQETGQLLETVNTFDVFPGSISLYTFMDFFNVKPIDYIVSITAHFPNGINYPVYATRVSIKKENLLYPIADGSGKSAGSFNFNFTIQQPSDFYFTLELIDPNKKIVDTFYSYHTFTTR